MGKTKEHLENVDELGKGHHNSLFAIGVSLDSMHLERKASCKDLKTFQSTIKIINTWEL